MPSHKLHLLLAALVIVACLAVARPMAAQAAAAPSSPGPEPQPALRTSPRPSVPVQLRLGAGSTDREAAAVITRVAGTNTKYLIELKRTALSPSLLAAAFAAVPSAVAQQARYPSARVAVHVSEKLPPRPLTPDDRERFQRLIAELLAKPPGEPVEVDPSGH